MGRGAAPDVPRDHRGVESSCPRQTVWEDALADGLVHIERGQVLLTTAGRELLAEFSS